MADATNNQDTADEPIYTAHFEIDGAVLQQATSLVAGDQGRNIATFISGAIILGLLFYCTMGPFNEVVALIWAGVAAASFSLGSRWRTIATNRLRKRGVDPSPTDHTAADRTVRVYDHTLRETRGDGTDTSWPLSSVRKVRSDSAICVVTVDEATVVIPRRALSLSRYEGLVRHLNERNSK